MFNGGLKVVDVLLCSCLTSCLSPMNFWVVSGINGLCEPICKYVDYVLKVLVETILSYLKDTTDALLNLRTSFREQHAPGYLQRGIVVHIDKTSRWFGGGLIFPFIDGHRTRLWWVYHRFTGIYFNQQFFIFRELFYLLLQGTAMRVVSAPSYANLLLGLWKRRISWIIPYHRLRRFNSGVDLSMMSIWFGRTERKN